MNQMSASNKNSRSNRKTAWLALLVIIALGLVLVITPIWIIQPFRPQTQRALEVSYAMRRLSPFVTILASVAAMLLALWLWRSSRWFSKVILVLLVLPLLAATWMSRQNHFEWMFRPHASVAYASAAEANFVGDNDMVLAVQKNEEAVAYPVRLMAYHHLVQDVVGGMPIVATY